jgi:hypothetical protein
VVARRARIAVLRAEVEAASGSRDAIVAKIEPSLVKRYERIFVRHRGLAVVEVRAGKCLGCHMQLPPQFYNELQRLRDLRLCPSCHRILFWIPPDPDAEE